MSISSRRRKAGGFQLGKSNFEGRLQLVKRNVSQITQVESQFQDEISKIIRTMQNELYDSYDLPKLGCLERVFEETQKHISFGWKFKLVNTEKSIRELYVRINSKRKKDYCKVVIATSHKIILEYSSLSQKQIFYDVNTLLSRWYFGTKAELILDIISDGIVTKDPNDVFYKVLVSTTEDKNGIDMEFYFSSDSEKKSILIPLQIKSKKDDLLKHRIKFPHIPAIYVDINMSHRKIFEKLVRILDAYSSKGEILCE